MGEQTAQRYEGRAGEEYHRGKREIPESAYDWVARSRAEKFQRHIRGGDTVLEHGVGYGWNLAALKCQRKIGYDVSAFLRPELERRGIEFVDSTGGLAAELADVVVSHHVLEHLLNPSEALAEMRRLLKPGGRLLLVTPAERASRWEHYNPAEPNHHLYTWTVQTLGNLAADCGFAVQEARLDPYGYDRFAAVRAVRWGLGERGFTMIRGLARLWKPIHEVRLLGLKKE